MEKPRYHHFDFLRAVAILLGLPLHACLAYTAIEYHWAVKDPSHSYLIDVMLDYLRLFRMPLFFAISGFFSKLVIDKGEFISKRTKRLLIPMLVFFPLFIVPLKAVWLAMEVPDKLLSGEFHFIASYVTENFLAGPSADKFRHAPNWGHLWFLMYLYLFSLISAPLSKINFLRTKLKIMTFPWLISLGLVLSYLSYFLMDSHWVDGPFYLYPKASIFIYYGVFYFFGWQLFNFKEIDLGKRSSLLLLVIGSLIALFRSTIEVNSYLNFWNLNIPFWLYTTTSVISTWALVLGWIFSFKAFFNKSNKIISYIVDGSYFIYLVHLPIIIILQVIFYTLPGPWFIKFPLNTLVSLVFSIIAYHFFVRKGRIEAFLKGNYRI